MAHEFDLDQAISLKPATTTKVFMSPAYYASDTGEMNWAVDDSPMMTNSPVRCVITLPQALQDQIKALMKAAVAVQLGVGLTEAVTPKQVLAAEEVVVDVKAQKKK